MSNSTIFKITGGILLPLGIVGLIVTFAEPFKIKIKDILGNIYKGYLQFFLLGIAFLGFILLLISGG
jgi:hypothetical protein